MANRKSGVSRRELVKGAAVAGLAAGLLRPGEARAYKAPPGMPNGPQFLPNQLQAPPTIVANPSSEGYWSQVRKAFALPGDYIHMNTGTTGSQPIFSLANLGVYNLWKSMDPRDWQSNLAQAFPDVFSSLGSRQAAIAAMYGANANEIVLSYNTTDACNMVFAGTPWNPGDRIITTTFEHPALNGPIAWARDYRGVEVVMVNIPTPFTAGVDEVLSWFEAELSKPLPMGAKQYVAFSEITYKNGLRLPVKEICELARSWGAYSIVDTAHGWGMIPIHCHDYAADFIAGAGHKWLCGGPGTGICYVRSSGSDLPPFAMGNFFVYGNPFQAPSANYDNRSWSPSSSMQSRGETNSPALYAMTDSARFFANVGLVNIYDRGLSLAAYLQSKVVGRWGPEALTVQSGDQRFKTFLTSINPFRDRNDPTKLNTFRTAMNQVLAGLAAETPKIYIRTVTWRAQASDPGDNLIAFRVSTHAMYNNYDQIDWMFDRLAYHLDQTGVPQLP